MDNGWIKLHRKLLESLVFQNEKGLKVWIWCLLRAGHKESSFLHGRKLISLKRGQFIMGSNKESEFLGIAKSTLWFWLEFLAKEGQIELKKTNKYTIITIPKWDLYQQLELKSETNQYTDGTQIGTNKKNTRIYKKNTNTSKADALRGDQWQELIDSFKEVNPMYLDFYKNKTERKALETMSEKIGYEKLLATIKALPQIINLPFAPKITRPTELKRDLGKLISFYNQEKLKGQKSSKTTPNFIL